MAFSYDAFLRFLKPLATWLDLLDVLLVALVLYNLMLLIRGTRAARVVLGILILVLINTSARTFRLPALETTLEKFFDILPVAILVLFQHEIRSALASFGRAPGLRFDRSGHDAHELIGEVVATASNLSDRRMGALIVFERRESLRSFIENGIKTDAVVSLDLLISIFHPETPTHDGAVIIQEDRIAATTCFLPLTRKSELSTELGTRHRAAIGITEETDAVAVVVSEESGDISLAFDGAIERRLSSATLRTLLFKVLVAEDEPERTPAHEQA